MKGREKFSLVVIILGLIYVAVMLATGGFFRKKTSSEKVVKGSETNAAVRAELKKEFDKILKESASEIKFIKGGSRKAVNWSFAVIEPAGKKAVEDKDQLEDKEQEKELPRLKYTSFLKTPDGTVAVLNGMSLSVGDIIFGTDFNVRKIDPDFIVVVNPKGLEYKVKFEQEKK